MQRRKLLLTESQLKNVIKRILEEILSFGQAESAKSILGQDVSLNYADEYKQKLQNLANFTNQAIQNGNNTEENEIKLIQIENTLVDLFGPDTERKFTEKVENPDEYGFLPEYEKIRKTKKMYVGGSFKPGQSLPSSMIFKMGSKID